MLLEINTALKNEILGFLNHKFMQSKNRELFIKARRFARDIHSSLITTTISGDRRIQFEHLQEVADLVWASGGTENEMVAAWLHDSVEDTPITLKDIEDEFGKEIAELVHSLTDSNEIKDLSLSERKAKQAERVKNENDSVKRIKLADQTSNIRFMTTDPKETRSDEERRDYAIGAKQIADQCKGVSAMLDQLFESEYKKAKEYFKI